MIVISQQVVLHFTAYITKTCVKIAVSIGRPMATKLFASSPLGLCFVKPVMMVCLSSQNSQNGLKMPLFGHFYAENFSASGGFTPWPGARPLDLAWGSAPDPHYRLALRARHVNLHTASSRAWAPGKQFLPTVARPKFARCWHKHQSKNQLANIFKVK